MWRSQDSFLESIFFYHVGPVWVSFLLRPHLLFPLHANR